MRRNLQQDEATHYIFYTIYHPDSLQLGSSLSHRSHRNGNTICIDIVSHHINVRPFFCFRFPSHG